MTSARPTLQELVDGLGAVPLPAGDVLVHASLRAISQPACDAATLLAAIRAVLGAGTTVVVPAQTTLNSTTSGAFREATRGMTAAQRDAYVATMRGFRPTDPGQRNGAFAEYVRTLPGAVRSGHPQASFAAIGPRAAEYLAVHDLDCHLGERSPLGALYRANAGTLLIGVGYEKCTSLHLAEYRTDPPGPRQAHRCFSERDGRRIQHDFDALFLDDSDFDRLGADLARRPFAVSGRLLAGTFSYVPIRAAVDFAVEWLTVHRTL